VRVNAIVPGGLRTDISTHWTPASAPAGQALGRLGEPRKVVGAALFLAGEASSSTTGALLTVDGGTALVRRCLNRSGQTTPRGSGLVSSGGLRPSCSLMPASR
jgi:hypothetical protein